MLGNVYCRHRSGNLQVSRSHLGRAVSHSLAVADDVDLLVPQPEAVAALLVAGEESKREHCYVELDGAPAVIAGATGVFDSALFQKATGL